MGRTIVVVRAGLTCIFIFAYENIATGKSNVKIRLTQQSEALEVDCSHTQITSNANLSEK